jgi:hypothetical protein
MIITFEARDLISLQSEWLTVFIENDIIISYVMRMNPISLLNILSGTSNGFSIFDDLIPFLNVLDRDLMAERNILIAFVCDFFPSISI